MVDLKSKWKFQIEWQCWLIVCVSFSSVNSHSSEVHLGCQLKYVNELQWYVSLGFLPGKNNGHTTNTRMVFDRYASWSGLWDCKISWTSCCNHYIGTSKGNFSFWKRDFEPWPFYASCLEFPRNAFVGWHYASISHCKIHVKMKWLLIHLSNSSLHFNIDLIKEHTVRLGWGVSLKFHVCSH